jgi:hypothetical protein
MNTEQLVQTLSSDLRPVRRLPGAGVRALSWAGLAVVCVAVGAAAVGLRPDILQKAHDFGFLARGLLLLAVSALAARSAFRLGVPGEQSARWLPIAAALAWAGLVAAGGLDGASTGWLCIARIALFSLVPAAAAFVMLRKAAPLSAGWTGAMALFATASLAMLGTSLVCPKDAPAHLLLWHLAPALLVALLGAQLGRWLFER